MSGWPTATGDTLDKWGTALAHNRMVSVDWQPGFRFSPKYGMTGRLMSIYEETDAHYRVRLMEKLRRMKS